LQSTILIGQVNILSWGQLPPTVKGLVPRLVSQEAAGVRSSSKITESYT